MIREAHASRTGPAGKEQHLDEPATPPVARDVPLTNDSCTGVISGQGVSIAGRTSQLTGQASGVTGQDARAKFGCRDKISRYTVGYSRPTNKITTKDYSQLIRVFDVDGYRMRADIVCFKDATRKQVSTSHRL